MSEQLATGLVIAAFGGLITLVLTCLKVIMNNTKAITKLETKIEHIEGIVMDVPKFKSDVNNLGAKVRGLENGQKV